MSHFTQGATATESLLELISNQLQLTQRQATQDKSGGDIDLRKALAGQIEKLQLKIIAQRDELKITVNGV